MKTKSAITIFFLARFLLCPGEAIAEGVTNDSDISDCYVYVSVNTDKKEIREINSH
jgi:hypothetical protein